MRLLLLLSALLIACDNADVWVPRDNGSSCLEVEPCGTTAADVWGTWEITHACGTGEARHIPLSLGLFMRYGGALNVVEAYGADDFIDPFGYLSDPSQSCGGVAEVYRDVTMTGTITFYQGGLFVSGTQTASAEIFFPRGSKSCEEMQESPGAGVLSLSCTDVDCGCRCSAEIVDGEFGHVLGYDGYSGELRVTTGLQEATDPNSAQRPLLATICTRGSTLLYDDGAVVITARRRSALPDLQ